MNRENRHKRASAIPLWRKILFSLIPLAVLLFSAELYFRLCPLYKPIVGNKQRQGRNWEEYQVKNLIKTPLSKEIKYAWELVFKELQEMNEISKNLNADFVILVTPFKFQLNADDSQLLPQKMLRDFAEKNNIDFIDLLPSFRKNKDKQLFADADHFSVEGHKVAAAVLEDFLEKKFTQEVK